MKVYLDNEGYVYLHAEDYEDIPEGYKQVPDDSLDIEHFFAHRNCYKWEKNTLVYHSEREAVVRNKILKDEIRMKREFECFPIINRGELWYKSLTESQLADLSKWYKSWLDAPETEMIPVKPNWI